MPLFLRGVHLRLYPLKKRSRNPRRPLHDLLLYVVRPATIAVPAFYRDPVTYRVERVHKHTVARQLALALERASLWTYPAMVLTEGGLITQAI
jgi:hypothetical protein